MKSWILPLPFALLSCTATSQNQAVADKRPGYVTPVKHKRINGYDLFYDLPKAVALRKGRALAREHFDRSEFRFLVYGLSKGANAFEKRLQDQYGIITSPIAGCIVSEGIVAAAKGYNETMRSLLAKHFGKDVFAESCQATH
jgi:hypothetical protein